MWLVNTSTYMLEEHYGDIPKYAILSHRWGEQELTFNEQFVKKEPGHKGYDKIERFVELARREGYGYVWADVCCIDKKSSAELSEAINSMYTYYKEAAICYAYLGDVTHDVSLTGSSWFTRGWTLQELLAPREVRFFNKHWVSLGFRQQLGPEIETVTGIPVKALERFKPADFCIAERLSWAAKRESTREEDNAYALLGLFEVNMPLLYGEGKRAFQRLQEEIMKINTDMSIFMWQGQSAARFGALAESAACFEHIWRAPIELDFHLHTGWIINNAGLRMQAWIAPYCLIDRLQEIYALSLHSHPEVSSAPRAVIFVQRLFLAAPTLTFRRVSLDGITCTRMKTIRLDLPAMFELVDFQLLRQPMIQAESSRGFSGYTLSLRSNARNASVHARPSLRLHSNLSTWGSLSAVSEDAQQFLIPIDPMQATGLHGYILFKLSSSIQLAVCFGLDHIFQPFCIILPLCYRLLVRELNSKSLLKAATALRTKTAGEICCDTTLHVVYLCSSDHSIASDNYFGVRIEAEPLLGSDSSEYRLKLSFDSDKFLQRYGFSMGNPIDGEILPGTLRKLADVENELLEGRLAMFGMPSRFGIEGSSGALSERPV